MKKPIFTMVISLVLVFGAGLPAQAAVINPDLQTLMDTLSPDDEVDVLVTLTDQVDLKKVKDKKKDKLKSELRTALITELKNKKDKTQKAVKDFLKAKKAKKIVSFWIFNGLAVTASSRVIGELAGQPGIESIRLDDTINAPEPVTAAQLTAEWNIEVIWALELWDLGYTGGGVVVANMDTGVDVQHPDLITRWRGGTNSWYDPNGEHETPYDKTGHGTQVMGVMVGGDAGGTAIGAAPGALWIAVKIFDDGGSASYSDIHLGFQWLLDPDGDSNTNDVPDVVNNSWGYRELVDQCFTEFQPDVRTLKAAEIAVVFSAGNGGPNSGTSESPANYPESFAVGAVDDNFSIADFSGRGPSTCDGSTYPELAAPGVNIKTTDLTFGGAFPNSYTFVSGTSIAAPHVSGAMALLLSAFPGVTIDELESALKASAWDLGPDGPDDDYGYGLLDPMVAYILLEQGSGSCTDADADGYFAEVNCGTELDCVDSDPGINPGACDIKSDGIDQDCDGRDRKKGKPCPGGGDDGGDDTGGIEGKAKTCSDGTDNDGDGLFDCDDPDCNKNKSCR